MIRPAHEDDARLKGALGSLVPSVNEAEGWAEVQKKFAAGHRTGTVAKAWIVVVALVTGAGVATMLTIDDNTSQTNVEAVAGNPEDESVLRSPPESEQTSSEETAMDSEVRVEPETIGPLEIRVGPLQAAEHGWQQHELVISNRSEDLVTVDLESGATVLERDGEPTLLVADEGCGYGGEPDDDRVTPGCRLVERAPAQVRPGESLSRTVTLWRDLPGFDALASGTLSTTRSLTLGGSSFTLTLHYTFR